MEFKIFKIKRIEVSAKNGELLLPKRNSLASFNSRREAFWQISDCVADGFTLIEILVSLAIVVMLATIAIIALNPTRQFASGRNTQRWANVNLIIGAVGQNIFDNKGSFSCSSGPIPTTTVRMAASSGLQYYNIAPCLVPVYLQNLPYDPATTSARYASVSDYDTGYTIVQNATTGRVTISAPAAELGKSILVAR